MPSIVGIQIGANLDPKSSDVKITLYNRLQVNGEDENVNDSGNRVSGLAILKDCEF